MRPFIRLVARFGRDESGVFAIMFGLMAVVLIAMGGAVVDYVRLEQTRNRAQIALDAAALALQKEISATDSEATIKSKALALMLDRIGDTSVTASIEVVRIDVDEGSLYLEGELHVPTLFVGLVGVDQLDSRIMSAVKRGSMNVEVAVAIDLTGSMDQNIATGEGTKKQKKVEALRDALQTLIPLIVQDQQTPTYSKMAIVPYSMAVNVGSTYADIIRGTVKGPTNITGVAWASGAEKTITAATKANPVVITSNGHGFANGDIVYIATGTSNSHMKQINNLVFTVANSAANTFSLQGVDGRNYNTFTSGKVTRCLVADCELVVTSNGHGLTAGSPVYISGVGNVSINNTATTASGSGYPSIAWPVGVTTTNTFVLAGSSRRNGNYGTYSSGGAAQCLLAGCEWYYFINPYGNARRHQISTCVTERTTNAYTDAPPATTLLGRNYPTSSNPCLSNKVVPLTADKTVLQAATTTLVASGSTAGHTGVGWAWYMVSPNFNGPWPQANQPAPATKPNVLKVVVLMTDGEFNSVYCDGVISYPTSGLDGSGSHDLKTACAAPNGSSYAQAEALCKSMIAAGIRVYTVGFDIVNSESARSLMTGCASSPAYAYQANTGQDLKTVFADIGRSIAELRVTQ